MPERGQQDVKRSPISDDGFGSTRNSISSWHDPPDDMPLGVPFAPVAAKVVDEDFEARKAAMKARMMQRLSDRPKAQEKFFQR